MSTDNAVLERRCAWCGALLCAGAQPVSHGICKRCAAAQLPMAGSQGSVAARSAEPVPCCGEPHPERPWSRCALRPGHDGPHETGNGWRWGDGT